MHTVSRNSAPENDGFQVNVVSFFGYLVAPWPTQQNGIINKTYCRYLIGTGVQVGICYPYSLLPNHHRE